MSRSYKKYAVYKDAGGYGTDYRKIKRRIKQFINSNFRQLSDVDFNKPIPKEKEIVNDWDVCDWEYKPELWGYKIDLEEVKKLKRK